MKNGYTPETLEEAIAWFESEGCDCDTVEESAAVKLVFEAAKELVAIKKAIGI